ncbi:MAG: hypothetical protein JRI23_11555 [Deltaproteobacteria bacterium]|jgi:uncharacterized delta-60 repeat protein|nr:hypothetical protein [Deltaproteobacteria bacterium]MBW2532334.1 hypothetical protein [Deltaproteobacteria bacterium]
MRSLPSLPRLSVLALAFAVAACNALLGDDFTVVDAAGGSGGTATGTATTAGSGGTGTGTQQGGNGGAQGQQDFSFSILPTSVNVPYDGTNYVEVEVLRSGGFDGAVEVTVQGAPPGLTTSPLTVAGDSSSGLLEVGASGTLVLGTTFDLELLATSGDLSHTDSVPAVVTGTPGTFDESFGTAGLASWQVGTDGGGVDAIREVAQQKILVAGNEFNGMAINLSGARLLSDGTMDTSFDTDGIIEAHFCGCTKTGVGVGVLRAVNGNVYFVGWASEGSGYSDDVALLRLKDDGTPDDDVPHDGGMNLFDLGTDSDDHALAMEPDANDRPTITGEMDGQLFVARIGDLQFGGMDSSYGTGGLVLPTLGASASAGQAIGIDSSGNAVVAGFVDRATRDLVVLRLTPAGALDATFGNAGVLEITRPGAQEAAGVAIRPDDSIVIAGITDETSANQDIFVLQVTPGGALDTAFGNSGITVVSTPATEEAVGIALMLDQRILVAGNDTGPLIARFLADGTPDPTYGTNGRQSINLGTDGEAGAITVAASGMTLLGGVRGSYPADGVVARIWN